MANKKPTASELDGVQYRRAKTWQIILYACNAFVGMNVYTPVSYTHLDVYKRQIHDLGEGYMGDISAASLPDEEEKHRAEERDCLLYTSRCV